MFLKTSNLFSDSRKNNTLSIIGQGIELSGEINTEGNIHIDGSMSGIIRANEVVIGPNGSFDGEIYEVLVVETGGKIQGELGISKQNKLITKKNGKEKVNSKNLTSNS